MPIPRKYITLASQVSKVDGAVTELVDFVAALRKVEGFALSIALTEAITNAVVHGNQRDPEKRVFAQVSLEPGRVVFQIADEGTGFDFKKLADPTKKENLLKQSGRGIFFLKYFMDEIRFNRMGNEITMVKFVE